MTKSSFKPKRILWMDLEMTGLDPNDDRILEVGTIVTDWEFKEVAKYEAVIKVDPALIERRTNIPFWDSFSAVRNALVKQNVELGRPGSDVETELLEFIDEHIGEDQVLLAGNSIHQDRRFIVNEWPTLDAKLHYRMLDVTAWKVVFEGKYGKKFAKPEAHRAIEDIRGSIEELQYYLKKIHV